MNNRPSIRTMAYWALAVVASACVDVGQTEASFELTAEGQPAQAVQTRQGWSVSLQRADIAISAVYLCSSSSAGDLCDVARAEWLGSEVVDALDPSPHPIGLVDGLTGDVRSMMYNMGSRWPLTVTSPIETEAGQSLGGASLVLEGIAERGDVQLPFAARVVVDATTAGRTVASQRLQSYTITADTAALTLHFNPERWVDGINFDDLLGDDGVPPNTGTVTIDDGTQPYRAVAQALVGQGRPMVSWTSTAP